MAVLERARYLVIVCSPHAAASPRLDEIVRRFKALGRHAQVLGLVSSGEPNASDKPNMGLPECFPLAMRFRVDEQGQLCSEREEPIAADVRLGRDSPSDALLRIAAGLLGVGFDELKRRAERTRMRRRLAAAGVVAGIAAIGLGLWRFGESQRQRDIILHEAARNQERGRLELMEGKVWTSLAYLAAAYQVSDTPALRLLLGEATRRGLPVLTLSGDTKLKYQARFSPDDKLVVTVSEDQTAKLWETDRGKLVRTLSGHGDVVETASFTPDGKRVITGSNDGTTRIWNVGDGTQTLTLTPSHYPGILEVDRAGTRLITGSSSGQAADTRVWHIETGKLLYQLVGFDGISPSVSFRPDGRRIATSCNQAAARVSVWDAETGELLDSLTGYGRSVGSIRYSPDGKRLITADGDDATVHLWDALTDQLVAVHNLHSGWVGSAVFSPDSKMFATATSHDVLKGCRIKIWDVSSGAPLSSLDGSVELCHVDQLFSPQGDMALASGEKGQATVWDVSTGTLLRAVESGTDVARSTEFSHDGERFVVANRDGAATIWKTPPMALIVDEEARAAGVGLRDAMFSPKGDSILTVDDHGEAKLWDSSDRRRVQALGRVASLSRGLFSAENSRLLVAASDGRSATLWDVHRAERIRQIGDSTKNITTAALSPDGSRIALALGDGSVELWDASNGMRQSARTVHEGTILDVSWSSDGRTVLTSGADGTVRVWNGISGESLVSVLKGHVGPVHSARFAASSTSVVSGGADGTTRVWDATTRVERAVFAGNGGPVLAAAFCAEDQRIAASTADKIVIWDLATGARLAEIAGHANSTDQFVSPDGQRIAVATKLGAVEVWDTRAAVPLVRLERQTRSVQSVSFDATGERIVSGSADGTARIWDASLEQRSPEEISTAVRCHIPYRIDGERLVPVKRDPPACAQLRAMDGRRLASAAE